MPENSYGEYDIIRPLDKGGMGEVFEACHRRLRKRAALKLLSADLSRRPEAVQRFFAEARASNIISHRGLAEVFDYGLMTDGRPYLAMEFLEGETLRARIARLSRLSIEEALSRAAEIASAMAAAHAKGIYHRDLKPANTIIRADDDRLQILDFGIAKLAAEHYDGETQHTALDRPIGTARYMSPEQCKNPAAVDGKADVYSLGTMLYEMVAGQTPFNGASNYGLMAQQLVDEPPPLRRLAKDAPRVVTALIHRMLVKEPEGRPTMAEVVSLIGAIQSGQAERQRRTRLAGVVVLVSLLVSGGVAVGSFLRTGGGPPAASSSPPPLVVGAGSSAPKNETMRTRTTTTVPTQALVTEAKSHIRRKKHSVEKTAEKEEWAPNREPDAEDPEPRSRGVESRAVENRGSLEDQVMH